LLNAAENNDKVKYEKSITEEHIRSFLDNYLRRHEKTEEEVKEEEVKEEVREGDL